VCAISTSARTFILVLSSGKTLLSHVFVVSHSFPLFCIEQIKMELQKTGWLEKFSVGRGLIPVKNWQKRFFTVNHRGLNYSKAPGIPGEQRTYIPFVTVSAEVQMNPVFLLPVVGPSIHPEAVLPDMFYFGLKFEEKGKPHALLLRTTSSADRESWVRFISSFVHVGAISGVPVAHPLDHSAPRAPDPEELDVREKQLLRRVIIDWDEGQTYRVLGESIEPNWDSDDDAPPVEVKGNESPKIPSGRATPERLEERPSPKEQRDFEAL
jgi:hypothetical protein